MQSITLNIRYDMPPENWGKIDLIYKSMDGWQGYTENGIPLWRISSRSKIILQASVEPSGLVFECSESSPGLEKWIDRFISKATLALGYEVKDADS